MITGLGERKCHVTFRKSRGVDLEGLKRDMRNQNWNDLKLYDDIDDAVPKWEELVIEILDKYMPFKTKRVRNKRSPWLNAMIFKLMKERDKMKNKAKLNKVERYWKEYRRLKNKVTFENRKAKKKYYCEMLSKTQNRSQSWNVLNSLISNGRSSSSFVSPCNDNENMANKFNLHFANVAQSLLIDKCEITSPTKLQCVDKSLSLSTVYERDVLKEIFKLKNKKSVGIDGISTYIIKMCANELVGSITYLINKSIIDGRVPDKWKIAKIIPLHKKGDKLNPDNYRPISLLPCVSKLLERFIQIQLIEHLNINEILLPQQSGFRPNHSTTTALIRVTDDWLKAMDSGQYTGAVFIDLQKAFDLVNHELLLLKLKCLGIVDKSLDWFVSYLSNRKIITSLNNVMSEGRQVTHGVPQGSIIGPILFVIFINDLASSIDQCSYHLYADDTVLYYSHKDPNIVQSILNAELQNLGVWMNRNQLKLNCQKTVSMLFGTRRMLSKHDNLTLQMKNIAIEKVNSTKYLGVCIDNELKWNIHVEHMCSKIGKMVGFLGRLRYFVNEESLKIIYKSIILPHFDYADAIWQSTSKTSLDSLQKLQNRAGRIILKLNPYLHTPVLQIHDILGWNKLSCRQNEHMYIMMFKILHGLTPGYLKSDLVFKVYNYSLRSNGNLNLPKPKTNNCKRTFFYRGASMYNQLSLHARNSSTVQSFKLNVQDYL